MKDKSILSSRLRAERCGTTKTVRRIVPWTISLALPERNARRFPTQLLEDMFPWILLSGRTNRQAVSLQDR